METLRLNTASPTPSVATPQAAVKSEVVHTDMNTQRTTQKHNDADMQNIVKELNTKSADAKLDISFGFNQELHASFISVVDKLSGQVIRKMPSEEAMKFAEGLAEINGKLLDKKG